MSHRHTNGPEHDYEPVYGLPEKLPADEHIVWQGAPRSRLIMRYVLRGRWIASYFALLIAWTLITGYYDGRTAGAILFSGAAVTILSGIVIVLMELFAWGVQKTTVYTITNKRIVMRIGVALSVTYNIPFAQIVAAEVKTHGDGTGDLSLGLTERSGLSWLMFYPHVRGSIFSEMRPRLTGLSDIKDVAAILAEQLQAYAARNHLPVAAATDEALEAHFDSLPMPEAAE